MSLVLDVAEIRSVVNRKAFGRRLRGLRAAAGLTQKQVADKLGQPQPNVARWESGLMEPPVTLLPKIARLFGLSLDDLFAARSGE